MSLLLRYWFCNNVATVAGRSRHMPPSSASAENTAAWQEYPSHSSQLIELGESMDSQISMQNERATNDAN
jgi:hypothetical protein